MVSRRISTEEARAKIEEAITSLGDVKREGVESADAQAILRASSTMLEGMYAVLSTTVGECRMAEPPAELYPVINASGDFQWCCTHPEEHCVVGR